MKILIVDDSAFMRNMIKNIIAKAGAHELFEAGNADEAVKLYLDMHPQLVFMDIIMPGRNGVECLKEIRSKDAAANVVMCTSVGQEQIINECVEAGASDFITKPFTPDEISKVLSKFTGP